MWSSHERSQDQRPLNPRRVHFSNSPVVEHEIRDVYAKPHSTTEWSSWFDRVDNDMFRLEASILAENLEFDPVLSKCIMKAYSYAGKVASSTKNETKLANKIVSIDVDACLLLWCDGPNNRGLENYFKKTIVRTIGSKTKRTIESSFGYRTMVIRNQAKLNDEKLRNKCLNLSRQDRVFARMMGEADATAAQQNSCDPCGPRAHQTTSNSEHSRLQKFKGGFNRLSQRQLVSKQA